MSTTKIYPLFLNHPEVCTDTRKISKGCLFFALKGERFNGNTFAKEALSLGAAYAIIDEETSYIDYRTILVDDVLTSLQTLATYHRNQFKIPVIALTGSNGKTTTKELIHSVLQKKYNTLATIGNYNNHIGVPLSLLRITKETEIAVIEMGANHLGEIALLSKIANPTHGYITNFGKAHLEGFGSEEGIVKGKSELYNYLKSTNRFIFYNADDRKQKEILSNHPKKKGFGQKQADVIIKLLRADPMAQLQFQQYTIYSKLIGTYNFTNIAAAILIGSHFEVPGHQIKKAIDAYTPKNNRSQIIKKKGMQIILDAYNANPSSMQAAIENFNQMLLGNKILILGDMFELGADAEKEHQFIAELATSFDFKQVFLVGAHFANTKTENAHICADFESLKKEIASANFRKANILIKGSRGMALERILDFI
ncbi:MAG: UDP-N-acetylmuramoyl-tripeptide--D-alanyl-D-alanine ligase [Flavobacteriaceae bacterium]|nr:UDP-N-acetylmuramoyl-tripeptide--D-alanyl-D-alanine ligase [Flavobacteriaceae bacterium]